MKKKPSPPKRVKASKNKISQQSSAEFATNYTNDSREDGQQAGNGSFIVVGLGASAGGIQAFKQLLAHLPADTGMAFVMVMRLDPKPESFPTRLAGATRMPVSEVQDGMAVAPNHVYIIPPNTSMVIEGGALRLRPREEGPGRRQPIDCFLQSLAEDRNARAIGVILSGTGADGTVGLEAIKAEGGITFAQDPKSAKFDGMSRSAIAAKCVDFVLSAEEIAKELERISRHPYAAPDATAKPDAEETAQPAGKKGIDEILTLLRQTTGVDFSLYQTNMLRQHISRRMILNRLDGLEEYAQYLRENAEEVENLYQDILINVTRFFRNPESFEVLKEKIFPRLVEPRAPDEPLRIWVMGCSTGEEAYSIAMAFMEFIGERSGHVPVQIFATDVNEKSLERARAGLYSKNITADVSPERLRRFFTEEESGYRVSRLLREMCVFARQNVTADPPFSRMDLISCRNLLIYLKPAVQNQILPLLHYNLKSTGILWLGSSETARADPELFDPVDKKHRFYAGKSTAERPRLSYFSGVEARKKDRAPSAVEIMGATATAGEKEARREAERIILARYAPASALINEGLNILQLRGDTIPYLEHPHGKAAGNLLNLAHEDLLLALRAAVDKARKDGSPVRKENLIVRYDNVTSVVNFEVIPLMHTPSQERYFLALFETAETEAEDREWKAVAGRRKSEGQQIRRLRQELAAARDYLRSVLEECEAANEELQTSGEEIQSSNEELQSVNEELETSKEELESSNEELTMLNEELNNRNAELDQLNSDLVNLLGSVQIPILMLDSHLRIRRFTPAAEKLLNLLQTDVGRPIGDLKLNFDYPAPERLIAEVIDTESVKEQEVRDNAGRWHSLRVHPYKAPDDGVDGAVVALVDIDAFKQTEREIKAERDYAEAILRTTRGPLIVLGADLRVHTANDAFYETFKVTADETEGCLIYDLGNRQWDIPKLKLLLEEIIPRNSFFNEYEVKHEFPTIGKRTMLLNARRLGSPESGPERILLGIDDVTERLVALSAMKEAEALRESEERFRTLADNAPVLIWVNNSTGCEFVNLEYLEFLGVGESEVLGDKWADFVHPEDRENYVQAFNEAVSRRDRFESEFRFRRRDGEYRWLRSVGIPRYEGAEFKGYAGSSLDIHDPKLAEIVIAQMAAIVESSDDAIISKDLNGIIMSWNEGAEKLFGYAAAEVIGKPITILIPPDRADEEPRILERLRRGERMDHFETVRRRKDGRDIDISLTVSPIRDSSGNVIGASKIARDITGRKRRERDRAMLSEISDQLVGITDIEETMERLGEKIGRYFGVKQCMFAETEDFETSIVPYGWNADGSPSLEGSRRIWDFLLEGLMAANLAGQSTVVNDTQTDSRVSAESYGALNIHSFIMVPLVRGGAWRFLLSIIDDQPRKWRDDEIDLMREITERVWTRLERARAEEALHESEAWLRSQKEAFQAAMNDAPLQASLGVLVRTAIERFGANAKAAFYVANDDGKTLNHVVGMSDAYEQCVDGFKIGANSLACGLAMHRGEPVITPDVMCEPRWQKWLWLAQEYNYRACWSVPIRGAAGPPVGTLALYFSEPRHPTPRDLEMAGVLTHAAAIIISRHKEVSERARAEERLRKSENQLRVITDAMPALISYIDKDCRYRFVNQTYTEWFGHAGAEIIGRTMADVLGAAAFEVLRPHVEAALAGKTEIFEAEIPYLDGVRFIRAIYTPDVAPDGGVRGIFVLVLDITESKKAEEMLREAQAYRLAAERRNAARLRELNLAAVEINAASSVEEVIHLINNKAMELTGARMAAVNLVPDGDWKRARTVASLSDEHAAWRDYDAPAPGEGVYMPVVREKRTLRLTQAELESHPEWRDYGQEAGNHPPLRGWLAAPLLGGNDECIGLVQLSDKWADGKAGEFTEADEALLQQLAQVSSVALENHQLYEQEQEAREIAEQATRAKDEFLAVVSHELRSPLNAILGWNRMLIRLRGDDPQIAKVVETVERSGKAQLKLIEDLMDTTRIVTGKIKLELGPVELADVVASALDALHPAADNKGIVIETNLDPEAGQITGDPERLQQVVWNLASNAIKFTPEGGRVRVELRRSGPGAQIVVRDTGQGISADLLPYVFDRFKQGNSSTSRRFGGLGLGLALVKHLVELHGGGVTVESPGEGLGATFTVSLPVRAIKGNGAAEGRKGEGSTFERRARPEPQTTRLEGVRALVVDDEAGARELLAATLGLSGASVTAADSADAALAEIESRLGNSTMEPFDVLISDIGMPDADGYELIRRVRKHPDERVSRTRAIALTAYARSEDRLRALQAGFHMHVPKPVDEEELTLMIAALTTYVAGA